MDGHHSKRTGLQRPTTWLEGPAPAPVDSCASAVKLPSHSVPRSGPISGETEQGAPRVAVGG